MILIKVTDLLPRKVHKHNCIYSLSLKTTDHPQGWTSSTTTSSHRTALHQKWTTDLSCFRHILSGILKQNSETVSLWHIEAVRGHPPQGQREVEARPQRIKKTEWSMKKQKEIWSSTSLFQSLEKYFCGIPSNFLFFFFSFFFLKLIQVGLVLKTKTKNP